MFGWIDFGEDGKKKVRNMGENKWKGCLIRRGNGEKMSETQLFSLHLPKLGKK